jgi:phage RecT family recombinase
MKIDGSDLSQRSRNGAGAEDKSESLKKQIARMSKEIERALPGKIGAERMTRIVMTAILDTPKLAECNISTFFNATLQSLQLGLEVNTPLGQAYLIPRWNERAKRLECNFQMGYQGLLELCYRSKQFLFSTAEIVYEGDTFNVEYGSNQRITHIPRFTSEQPQYVWALYKLSNGAERFTVWTWDKAMRHGAEYSESRGPWSSGKMAVEEMAKKSVLKNFRSVSASPPVGGSGFIRLGHSASLHSHGLFHFKHFKAGKKVYAIAAFCLPRPGAFRESTLANGAKRESYSVSARQQTLKRRRTRA